MSPPLFLLGTLSILTSSVITNLGFSSDIWTFGILPFFSIYFLCDQRKLWEGLTNGKQFILIVMVVPFFSMLWMSFTSYHFILWRLWIVLIWLLCMIRGYDLEKRRYMTYTYGDVAKSLLWRAANRFISQATRMSYKGEWAYCSPYSRERVKKEIDHYYILEPNEQVLDEISNSEDDEDYEFSFVIESSTLLCRYTTHTGGNAAPVSTGGFWERQRERQPSLMLSERLESWEGPVLSSPSLPSTMLSEGPPDKGKTHTEATSSEAPSWEGAVLSGPTKSQPSPMLSEGLDSTSSGSPSWEGESSLGKVEPGVSKKYSYILVPSHVNKLELSLKYENKTLESYVFFNRASGAVMELKHVLNVLQDEGSMIFSSFNRNNGSSRPQAHASFHEFGELLNLVLNRSHKLQEVNLPAKFECIISGTLELLNNLFLVGITLAITYFQLTALPKTSIVILLLVFYGFISASVVLSPLVRGFSMRNKVREFVHFLIDIIFPGKKKVWYKCFQIHAPWLTFGNESYGYPFTSQRKSLCVLGNEIWIHNVTDIEDRIDCMDIHLVGDLTEGLLTFTLENRNLDLQVKFKPRNYEMVIVDLKLMIRSGGIISYNKVEVPRVRVRHFIALMIWLEKNDCVGVCKKWPKTSLVYAYRYPELFQKVFTDIDNWKPSVLTFQSHITVTVQ